MLISDGDCEVEAAELAEVRPALRRRKADGSNEFWIMGDGDYPHIALLVRGSNAFLHYFPEESNAGLISVGDERGDGIEEFLLSCSGGSAHVTLDAVISLDVAYDAVERFFVTRALPDTLRWREL